MKCQPASELDSLPDKCEQVTSFAALRLLFCVCRVRLEVVKRAVHPATSASSSCPPAAEHCGRV